MSKNNGATHKPPAGNTASRMQTAAPAYVQKTLVRPPSKSNYEIGQVAANNNQQGIKANSPQPRVTFIPCNNNIQTSQVDKKQPISLNTQLNTNNQNPKVTNLAMGTNIIQTAPIPQPTAKQDRKVYRSPDGRIKIFLKEAQEQQLSFQIQHNQIQQQQPSLQNQHNQFQQQQSFQNQHNQIQQQPAFQIQPNQIYLQPAFQNQLHQHNLKKEESKTDILEQICGYCRQPNDEPLVQKLCNCCSQAYHVSCVAKNILGPVIKCKGNGCQRGTLKLNRLGRHRSLFQAVDQLIRYQLQYIKDNKQFGITPCPNKQCSYFYIEDKYYNEFTCPNCNQTVRNQSQTEMPQSRSKSNNTASTNNRQTGNTMKQSRQGKR